MAQLTVAELRDDRQLRRGVNHDTYRGIWEVVQRTIRRVAVHAESASVTVPALVPGRPLFTHAHAVKYVRGKLARAGFDVRDGDEPGVLLVDWRPRPPPPPAKTPKRAAKPPKPPKAPKPPKPPKPPDSLARRVNQLRATLGLAVR